MLNVGRKFTFVCLVAVASLAMYGCGGSGSSTPTVDTPPPATITPAPTMGYVELPAGHSLVSGTEHLDAGESITRGGVVIMCAADAGDAGCSLTVEKRALDDVLVGMWTGGAVTAAAVVPPAPPLGYDGIMSLGNLLREGPLEDDMGPAGIAAVDMMDGKITMSNTTHDASGALTGDEAGAVDGVNDMRVTVELTPNEDNSLFAGCDQDGKELCDEGRADPATGEFSVTATWADDNKAADVWTYKTGQVGNDDVGVTRDENDVPVAAWNLNEKTVEQQGGRTVHVDLYTDADLGNKVLASTNAGLEAMAPALVETNDTMIPLAAATVEYKDGVLDKDSVWSNVRFMKSEYNPGSAVDTLLSGDQENLTDAMEEAVFKGVPGIASCVGVCSIRRDSQTGSVTYVGAWMFTPAVGSWVYTEDMDWLAAGVWITAPDDAREGDYAVGAYVNGSQPFTDILPNDGEATYEGQAFGRYAENQNGDKSSARFTAVAELTATFGATNSIDGDLTGFMTDGESRDWDLNLQSTEFDQQNNGDPVTFNGSVSGHGGAPDRGGHNLDGIWNGQFFGNDSSPAINTALAAAEKAAMDDDDLTEGDATTAIRAANDDRVAALTAAEMQPGSVAGTFTATDRDTTDSYSLTLIGAFGAHNTEPDPPSE